MKTHPHDAYALFEQDHRTFGAEKGAYSPSLRIKALIVVTAAAVFFWSGIFYLAFAGTADQSLQHLATSID